VPYNKIDALDKAVNEETAAVILEVVQGEGGVYPTNREYIEPRDSSAMSAARFDRG
jgi:acetylornithine/LysW-gamma-L-lysine aminotransferase